MITHQIQYDDLNPDKAIINQDLSNLEQES